MRRTWIVHVRPNFEEEIWEECGTQGTINTDMMSGVVHFSQLYHRRRASKQPKALSPNGILNCLNFKENPYFREQWKRQRRTLKQLLYILQRYHLEKHSDESFTHHKAQAFAYSYWWVNIGAPSLVLSRWIGSSDRLYKKHKEAYKRNRKDAYLMDFVIICLI